jgi:Protein of unknown function (DUF3800)
VFWGFIDESGDDKTNLRTLSCLAGHYSNLFWFRIDWDNAIARKNRELARQGRKELSRFHATEWSTKNGDFEGWSEPEKIEFFESLLVLFDRYPVVGCSQAVYKHELAEVFPEAVGPDRVDHLAHVLLLFLIVMYIDSRLLSLKEYATDRIAFVHDSTRFKPVLHDAFEWLKTDPGIKNRGRLVSIEENTWQEEPLLQAADLIAYENFKVIERKMVGAGIRKTMQRILASRFAGINARLTKESLQVFRANTDKVALNRILAQARMRAM